MIHANIALANGTLGFSDTPTFQAFFLFFRIGSPFGANMLRSSSLGLLDPILLSLLFVIHLVWNTLWNAGI